ncbi:HNH endonuclease [bacterium]|nr:HNH endonuclease [bacterium]
MRIHGEKKIVRRALVEHRSPYGKYKDILREDFAEICGYCGKSEAVTKNAFETDHFIPLKYAPEKEEDYYNLVYSCYECNRKKASKWPSKDKNIQFVNGEGFVDPASDDYDNHLERDTNGNIIGKTDVGRYMVEKGFEFNKRPMREIYKAMQLIEKKQQLYNKRKSVSKDELQEYIEADELLAKVQRLLFENKE